MTQLDADEAERLVLWHPRPSPWVQDARRRPARRSTWIRRLAKNSRTLYALLDPQVIVEVFGGEVGFARQLVHGKAASVTHDGRGIFAGVRRSFEAGRYHSPAATTCAPSSSRCRRPSADGEVMGSATPGTSRRRCAVPPGVGVDVARVQSWRRTSWRAAVDRRCPHGNSGRPLSRPCLVRARSWTA